MVGLEALFHRGIYEEFQKHSGLVCSRLLREGWLYAISRQSDDDDAAPAAKSEFNWT
jgi:hypothetical protein